MNNLHSNCPQEVRVAIKIPRNFYQEPIISQLTSRHHLEVNIIAAILGKNGLGNGWFDLQLRGDFQQIDNALEFLSNLDIEIWNLSKSEKLDEW